MWLQKKSFSVFSFSNHYSFSFSSTLLIRISLPTILTSERLGEFYYYFLFAVGNRSDHRAWRKVSLLTIPIRSTSTLRQIQPIHKYQKLLVKLHKHRYEGLDTFMWTDVRAHASALVAEDYSE